MTRRIVATVALSADAAPEDRERICAMLGELDAAVPEISHSHAGVHIEGSLGAGDSTWDFAVPEPSALAALTARLEREGWAGFLASASPEHSEIVARVERVEAWLVEPLCASVPHRELAGIKRTNLVRVLEDAAPASVEQWQREVPLLARHVPAIRNWSLSRVRAFGPGSPRVRWTHAWEQEFETLEGLLEDYMASPYHWGYLDAWYDAEMPHRIIDSDLAHLYCHATSSALSWSEVRPR